MCGRLLGIASLGFLIPNGPVGMVFVISLSTNRDLCSSVLSQILVSECLFFGILHVRNFSKGGEGLHLIDFQRGKKILSSFFFKFLQVLLSSFSCNFRW